MIRSVEDIDNILMKAATKKTIGPSRGGVSTHDGDVSSDDEDNQLSFVSPNPN